MTSAERYELATMGKMLEDYDVDVCTLKEFETLFNTDSFDTENSYIFFHVIG